MASQKKQCPDCRSDTVEGFILDMTYGGQLVPRWVAGSPEKSIWTGVKAKGKECRSGENASKDLMRSFPTQSDYA